MSTDGDYVRIFDTTLRDGEQSPGATMTLAEKLRIAQALEGLRVDAIEAGFPAASLGEIEAVRAISEVVEHAEIVALCRTRDGDIEAAWKAIGQAKKPRIHVFIATSALHMEHKLRMTPEQVLKEIERGVSACRSLCPRVEFSAEDATRSDMGFLKEAMSAALDAGATVLNVPDTVGYAMPDEYAARIAEIVALAGDRAIISAHCHDDLGLAVANSIAAVQAGARQVEVCVNGIGERAGNAALEEVVMALRTRRSHIGIATNINTPRLLSASRLVSDITGFSMQPNKAVVGRNAFAHESGIHQQGMLRERNTYEIMNPTDVGFAETSLVLGKHSGRAALAKRFETLGYSLTPDALADMLVKFKALADRKKNIYDDDLRSLWASRKGATEAPEPAITLEHITFRGGSDGKPTADVKLIVDGVPVEAHGVGDGPVDAVITALRDCVGAEDLLLEDYAISSVTGGTDAQGRVYMTVSNGTTKTRGNAIHTDVVVASAMAFVDALNRHRNGGGWSPRANGVSTV